MEGSRYIESRQGVAKQSGGKNKQGSLKLIHNEVHIDKKSDISQ